MATRVTILQRDAVVELLRSDPGGFVAALDAVNLRARGGHRDAASYIEHAVAWTRDPPRDHGFLSGIRRACDLADSFFATWRPDARTHGLARADAQTLAGLPWIIAFTPDTYESGLPHTRGEVICLPRVGATTWHARQMLVTLAHEKVHVYQRMYPGRAVVTAGNIGCRPFAGNAPGPRGRRANPDVHGAFVDAKGTLMDATFVDADPRSLHRARPSSALGEHPHEIIAYRTGDAFGAWLDASQTVTVSRPPS